MSLARGERGEWWSFDIETQDWETLVVACAHSENGRALELTAPGRSLESDCQAVLDWYLALPSTDVVWSHNGGGFDFLFLISVGRHLEWTARMGGSSIISCRAKGHAELRDSSRIFAASLAKWTGRKEATGLDCECGEGCGGYCAIRRDMAPEKRRRLVDYCHSDCDALLSTLRSDLDRLVGEGLAVYDRRGMPRLTFGGIAWQTAARLAGLDPSKVTITTAEYRAGRRAYFGGRCEVGQVEAPTIYRYDVHAMYPWALTAPVPHGERRGHSRDEAARAYLSGAEGAFQARVVLPDNDLPLLPHRYAGERAGRFTPGRVVWSTGFVEGWWTGLELRAAEAWGARIESVSLAFTWDRFDAIYEPYVRMIYDARDRATRSGDERWASGLKFFANAVTGKLAQRPGFARMIVTSNPPHDICDECLIQGLPGCEHSQWTWHGGNVYSKEEWRLSACSRPIEAAYLTSRARVKLATRLLRHTGRWIYADTDSTYLLDPDERDVHASELGTFGFEGCGSEWLALAPKLYRYRDQHGAPKVRAKGIPAPAWETLPRLQAGLKERRERGVERLRSSGGAFKRRTIERGWHDHGTEWCGTRKVRPNGRTVPAHRARDGSYDWPRW